MITLWIHLIDLIVPPKRFPRLNEWILVHTTPKDY